MRRDFVTIEMTSEEWSNMVSYLFYLRTSPALFLFCSTTFDSRCVSHSIGWDDGCKSRHRTTLVFPVSTSSLIHCS